MVATIIRVTGIPSAVCLQPGRAPLLCPDRRRGVLPGLQHHRGRTPVAATRDSPPTVERDCRGRDSRCDGRRSGQPARRRAALARRRLQLRLLGAHAHDAAGPARLRDHGVPLLHLPLRGSPRPPHGDAACACWPSACASTPCCFRVDRIPPWRFALSFALLALTAGAMAITNTWDFPTYVGLGAVSIALPVSGWHPRRLSRALAYRTAGLLLLFAMLALAFWLPFHLRLENDFPGLGVAPVTTPIRPVPRHPRAVPVHRFSRCCAVEALPRFWGWAATRGAPWQLVLGFVVGVLGSLVIALTVFGLGVVAMLGVALVAVLLAAAWVGRSSDAGFGAAHPFGAKGAAPIQSAALGTAWRWPSPSAWEWTSSS